jgi:hypothetical protein
MPLNHFHETIDTKELEPVNDIERAFISAVVEAIRGDHNNLRREAIIIRAFRAAIASQQEVKFAEPSKLLASIDGAIAIAKELQHWSDCAVHNEPAFPAGECNCGGYKSEAV